MKDLVLFRKYRVPFYTVRACAIALITQAISYWLPMVIKISTTTTLTSKWDEALPVIPLFVIPYFGAYILWAVGYYYNTKHNERFANRFLLADLMCRGICLIVFIVYPCTLNQPEPSGFCAWMLRFLYSTDQPINLLPSMHCYLTHLIVRPWLAGYFREIKKPVRIGCYIFAVLIYLSTLFTKQHVIVDVITGIALAEIMWHVSGLIIKTEPFSNLK